MLWKTGQSMTTLEVSCPASEKSHVVYLCRFKATCLFKVRASFNVKKQEATCTILVPNHNCAGFLDVKRSLASHLSWLLEAVPRLLSVTKETSAAVIQDALLIHREVTVPIAQCRRVKAALLQESTDNARDDYSKLGNYIQRLQDANQDKGEPSELVTDLVTDLDSTFKRIFIGPQTSRQAFEFGVPFIALDGTYLRNCFRKTLLTAVGRTANNKTNLLAWAIVELENTSSWTWFLDLLKQTLPTLGEDLGSDPRVCVISDRDKGLKAALQSLEHTTIVNCCWHLQCNVIKKSKASNSNKGLIREAWWRFPYCKS